MTEISTPSAPLRVVVLASGTGSLLQSMLDSLDGTVEIVAVGADRPCRALTRAEDAGLTTFLEEYAPAGTPGHDRAAWNHRLAERIAGHRPDLVVSAGFMRILGEEVVDRFRGRIINTHPALLPAFPGAHAVADALNYGVAVTGSTVHVVDTGVDTGPILAQRAVDVRHDDTVDTLHERIKTVERQLIVDVLHAISRTGYSIDGRKAWINHD
ncbi:phosphoribosylglycinamide formyltransferase [Corynebacterium bovis]|uniref:Phosphoribosylglycinamide formyltransferase n=1 Tax=Corynebacterium bovis DSM 20582 = CIP 54.80 TaxID=927655 RepID=A0A8H9Y9B6_9CORY|nr:phosphoribosylglycinamide formyltransferase [Corynebacterium bovis]MBB3115718.1 phosphoribosylglycinamide formyltransferase-1 [Corynebacterium bovis DSM 20582 = CIP 54.80]MDH2455465.1 phosphoribosylglycinamide formyltransferase [Corynebacterium bovis]QQC47402.1 phosphoribosylglycinamide formyltransferase [Corynebacterium bovis]RRO82221.1 phosphoribosylglycinamide formyltransferase [Corynebacterium bovis]RRO82843.1 phosphoribosylglycinamide formyltransferase [Corynebacterium bovis]